MVMQHLYSYMRRGNESWTWQLSPQDVHWYHLVSVGASKSGDGIQKKKIVGACEACEPIQSPPPLIFPRFIRLAGKFACFLRTLAYKGKL